MREITHEIGSEALNYRRASFARTVYAGQAEFEMPPEVSDLCDSLVRVYEVSGIQGLLDSYSRLAALAPVPDPLLKWRKKIFEEDPRISKLIDEFPDELEKYLNLIRYQGRLETFNCVLLQGVRVGEELFPINTQIFKAYDLILIDASGSIPSVFIYDEQLDPQRSQETRSQMEAVLEGAGTSQTFTVQAQAMPRHYNHAQLAHKLHILDIRPSEGEVNPEVDPDAPPVYEDSPSTLLPDLVLT